MNGPVIPITDCAVERLHVYRDTRDRIGARAPE